MDSEAPVDDPLVDCSFCGNRKSVPNPTRYSDPDWNAANAKAMADTRREYNTLTGWNNSDENSRPFVRCPKCAGAGRQPASAAAAAILERWEDR